MRTAQNCEKLISNILNFEFVQFLISARKNIIRAKRIEGNTTPFSTVANLNGKFILSTSEKQFKKRPKNNYKSSKAKIKILSN